MSVGDIMSTLGDVQYSRVYHDECRGYHEYTGGCSVHQEDTKMHVGVIMSTPGVFSTLEGYHEYTRGVQYTEGIP